jgi:hypothetical protein
MAEEKKPTEKAKESLEKGFKEMFRAAESVADKLKRETQKSGSLTKAFDDAGREIVRAASNVASFVGGELQEWGKKAQDAAGGPPGPHADAHHPTASGPNTDQAAHMAKKDPSVTGEETWPKTREEYEQTYESEGNDWPRSRDEYIRRFGRPPTPKTKDPGFRIATDK